MESRLRQTLPPFNIYTKVSRTIVKSKIVYWPWSQEIQNIYDIKVNTDVLSACLPCQDSLGKKMLLGNMVRVNKKFVWLEKLRQTHTLDRQTDRPTNRQTDMQVDTKMRAKCHRAPVKQLIQSQMIRKLSSVDQVTVCQVYSQQAKLENGPFVSSGKMEGGKDRTSGFRMSISFYLCQKGHDKSCICKNSKKIIEII